jgi:hypothetical protein
MDLGGFWWCREVEEGDGGGSSWARSDCRGEISLSEDSKLQKEDYSRELERSIYLEEVSLRQMSLIKPISPSNKAM